MRATFALVVAAGLLSTGCRLLAPSVPCAHDGNCRYGERCIASACVADVALQAGPVRDDGGAPAGDSGALDDAGAAVDDGGAPGDDAGALVDGGPAPAWWDPSYSHRLRVTFANGARDALAHFPALVRIQAGSALYSASADDAHDLRFVDVDGNQLHHRVARWDEAGESLVWVRVPEVAAYSDESYVWLYTGNPSASPVAGLSTWASVHAGVWHLDRVESADRSTEDQSQDPHPGTLVGFDPSAVVEGVVAGALSFGGDDVVWIQGSATGSLDVVSDSFTLSAWVFPTGSGAGTIVAKRGDDVAQYQLELDVAGAGLVAPTLIVSDASKAQCIWSTDQPIPVGAWHFVAVVADSSGQATRFFVDGADVPFSQVAACAGGLEHRDFDVAIGARWSGLPPGVGYPFAGLIDEVRVETTQRSADWLDAQYRSMLGTLVSIGPLEQQ